MGLDMYLRASKYVGGWDHGKENERLIYNSVKAAMGCEEFNCDSSPSLTINLTVAYWRKSNMVHAWFVHHVGDDKDECQPCHCEREKLVELRELCAALVKSKDSKAASEKLPPQAGFFFGGTDMGEWYWEGLQDTVEQLDAVLNNPAFENCDFIYQASW